MNSNRSKDVAVGVHKDSDRSVYQCQATGLLYYFDDPPKRFVSVHSVELAGKKREQRKEER